MKWNYNFNLWKTVNTRNEWQKWVTLPKCCGVEIWEQWISEATTALTNWCGVSKTPVTNAICDTGAYKVLELSWRFGIGYRTVAPKIRQNKSWLRGCLEQSWKECQRPPKIFPTLGTQIYADDPDFQLPISSHETHKIFHGSHVTDNQVDTIMVRFYLDWSYHQYHHVRPIDFPWVSCDQFTATLTTWDP